MPKNLERLSQIPTSEIIFFYLLVANTDKLKTLLVANTDSQIKYSLVFPSF